jgi:carboxyl-terminal processing protease
MLALAAAVYDLTPVPVARVLTLADGRKAGYLLFKDFITQAEPALAAAFADFRAAGATELILDLRYNGGGRISVASKLASLIAGAAKAGEVLTTLRHNAAQQSRNQTYYFASAPGPAFARAVVLAGRRTCSASELLVNGLAPHLPVVLIGEASCGKPFGFNPVDSCGSTFSAVNFESVNSLGAGRYYDGLSATCAARDSFTGTLGDPAEPLTASAIAWLDSGACAPAAAQRTLPLAAPRRGRGATAEPGDFQAMIAD